MTYIPTKLRQQVIERANNCCEYCRVHQQDRFYPFEVDHIIPIKHRGETTAENLCLTCMKCNRHKGADFASFDPDSGEIVPLYNPRTDDWAAHFRLDDATIAPQTTTGRVTVFVLKLNAPARLTERATLIAAGRYPPPEDAT
jgi:hypothetical protein